MSPHCCSPPRSEETAAPGPAAPPTPGAAGGWHPVLQAHIPAGTFAMGDGTGDRNRPDGEDPVHLVHVSAFDIDTISVTVADFARFAEATGYRTDAERFGFTGRVLGLYAVDGDVVFSNFHYSGVES